MNFLGFHCLLIGGLLVGLEAVAAILAMSAVGVALSTMFKSSKDALKDYYPQDM